MLPWGLPEAAGAAAAQRFNSDGLSPLHLATSAALVRTLAHAWPAGLTTADARKKGPRRRTPAGFRGGVTTSHCRGEGEDWPLHRAIRYDAPASVVSALEGLTPMDAFGNRPERFGFASKSNQRDIKLLHQRSKQTRDMKNAMRDAGK